MSLDPQIWGSLPVCQLPPHSPVTFWGFDPNFELTGI